MIRAQKDTGKRFGPATMARGGGLRDDPYAYFSGRNGRRGENQPGPPPGAEPELEFPLELFEFELSTLTVGSVPVAT